MITKKQTFTFGDVQFHVDPKKPYITMEFMGLKRSIKKNELWTMVFTISKDKKQADLIPAQKKEMMQFERQHVVKITKDMKAGETMKVKCLVDIPLTIVEAHLSKKDMDDIHEIVERDSKDIPSPFVQSPPEGV